MRVKLLVSNCMRFSRIEFRNLSSKKYADNLDSRISFVNVSYFAGKDLEQLVSTKAAIVDSHGPGKEPRATIIAVHGSPGSHNDYKYMLPSLEERNIRTICINYPGFGFTEGGIEHSYTNNERNNYVQAVLKSLDIKNSKNIILLGHSRAGENSLQLANILSKEDYDVIAAIPINSTGVRMHRGVRSRYSFIVSLATAIRWQNPLINFFLYPLLFYFYNNVVGLKVPTGQVAAVSILPLTTFAFAKQRDTIKELDANEKIKVCFTFGTNDYILETSVSEEIVNVFEDVKIITENSKTDSLEEAKEVIRKGQKNLAVRFIGASHFLQKTHAPYLVDVIDEYVKNRKV